MRLNSKLKCFTFLLLCGQMTERDSNIKRNTKINYCTEKLLKLFFRESVIGGFSLFAMVLVPARGNCIYVVRWNAKNRVYLK